MPSSKETASGLCLACGLCCNGVLFKDVELQPGDDPARLAALGQPVRLPRPRTARGASRTPPKFPQPCAALCEDNRCRIYRERPSRCREFECALFKAVRSGEIGFPAALKSIRAARQRAEKVRLLLSRLGDTEEHLALSLRFKRMRRRLESGAFGEAEVEIFGELTLAVHALNLLLSREFYPGSAR